MIDATIWMVLEGSVPDLMRREQNAVVRAAMRQMGITWHQKIREKHFTNAGAAEYGYMKRSGDVPGTYRKFARTYQGRKLKKYGHTRPLEYTGMSRMRSRIRDVRATATAKRAVAKVFLHTNQLNFRPKNWPYPMGEELRAISRGDADLLIATLHEAVLYKLKNLRRRKRIKVH